MRLGFRTVFTNENELKVIYAHPFYSSGLKGIAALCFSPFDFFFLGAKTDVPAIQLNRGDKDQSLMPGGSKGRFPKSLLVS